MALERQLAILQHSLGLNEFGEGSFFRNHFVVGPYGSDRENIKCLVNQSFMEKSPVLGALIGEDSECFHVTALGIDFVKKKSPTRARKTKSQQRGARWREYGDCFDSFRDFLKWDSLPERSWNKK